jgi:hypothetical protein
MSRHARHSPTCRTCALVLLALTLNLSTLAAFAADLKLEALQVWGSNDRPSAVQHPVAAPDLAATLRHNFKWTNYYQITNLSAVIPLNESRVVRISDQCTLTIKNLGSSKVAVDCVVQGKPVSKGTNTLPCVYAGTNANDTGWFIRLRSLDPKN